MQESSRNREETDVGRKRTAQRRSKIGSRVQVPCANGSGDPEKKCAINSKAKEIRILAAGAPERK